MKTSEKGGEVLKYKSKDSECDIHERKCARCGRIFIVAPFHAYKDGVRLYCTYSCYMRAKEDKEAAHRARIEERRRGKVKSEE